jgi:valyl-tRNA synthetase
MDSREENIIKFKGIGEESISKFQGIIEKMADIKIHYASPEEFDKLEHAHKFMSGGIEMALILPPDQEEDLYEEHKQQLENLRIFLEKTEEKLLNENFIKKAPKDIIDKEYKKWWDCIAKINFMSNLYLDDIQKKIDKIKRHEGL